MRARDLFNLSFAELFKYFNSYNFVDEYFRATKKIYASIEEEALFGLSGYTKPVFFERCRVKKRHPLLDMSEKLGMVRVIMREDCYITVFYNIFGSIRKIEKNGESSYFG